MVLEIDVQQQGDGNINPVRGEAQYAWCLQCTDECFRQR
jgi:hypothetical protein